MHARACLVRTCVHARIVRGNAKETEQIKDPHESNFERV